MDYETVTAEDFGKSLKGVGINILVRDVLAQIAFLESVFELKAHRASADFAIIPYGDHVFQLHSDGTYHSNPLLTILPENPPRGAGVEIYGAMVLQPPSDKPHGLREAYILCDNGYAWVPSRHLS